MPKRKAPRVAEDLEQETTPNVQVEQEAPKPRKRKQKPAPVEAVDNEVTHEEQPDTNVNTTADQTTNSAAAPKKKKKKVKRLHDEPEDADAAEQGTIYVGHLPYGFDEDGLKDFFSQFGDVTRVVLFRSPITGRSRGYAYIQFKFKEVAKIAAQAINGYLIYGKQLVVELLPEDRHVPFDKLKRFKYIPWKKIFRKEYNKEKTSSELKRVVRNLLRHEEEKRKKIEELGIKYTFPGFSALVEARKV
eukprot:TRINITY_DN6002_c0_g1_i8.p1 TRINITY_DN6002_c0_g1~~TRINITY_DN6002_c0_g1_i8.p1  ORF type:complete len:246 (+),score=87.98 TRINITY_DN6002_c0_g1_i8:56-793(+)